MTTDDVFARWLAEHGVESLDGRSMPVHFPLLTREDLYALWETMGLDRGAEIGVLEADNSVAMLQANPRLELLCVDPWQCYEAYHDYRRQSKMDAYYEAAILKTEPYDDRCRLVRVYSMDAARDVPDESLDLVYIDGNHEFDFVMEDIITWSRKVRPGGVVSGHDYYRTRQEWIGRQRTSRMQVIDAVEAYRAAHRIDHLITVGGGPKHTDAIPPSWMWIKPEPHPWPANRSEGRLPSVPEVAA